MIAFPLRRSSIPQHYSSEVTKHRPKGQPESVLSDTVWHLPTLRALVCFLLESFLLFLILVDTRLPRHHNSVALYCQSVSAASRPGRCMCEQETGGSKAQHRILPEVLVYCLGDKANDVNTIRGRDSRGRWRWPWPLPWYHTPGQRHLSSGAWLFSWTPQPSPLSPVTSP